eukprot:scaffold3208_cov107-Cylindrotheca_fusiformis.AAC.1
MDPSNSSFDSSSSFSDEESSVLSWPTSPCLMKQSRAKLMMTLVPEDDRSSSSSIKNVSAARKLRRMKRRLLLEHTAGRAAAAAIRSKLPQNN